MPFVFFYTHVSSSSISFTAFPRSFSSSCSLTHSLPLVLSCILCHSYSPFVCCFSYLFLNFLVIFHLVCRRSFPLFSFPLLPVVDVSLCCPFNCTLTSYRSLASLSFLSIFFLNLISSHGSSFPFILFIPLITFLPITYFHSMAFLYSYRPMFSHPFAFFRLILYFLLPFFRFHLHFFSRFHLFFFFCFYLCFIFTFFLLRFLHFFLQFRFFPSSLTSYTAIHHLQALYPSLLFTSLLCLLHLFSLIIAISHFIVHQHPVFFFIFLLHSLILLRICPFSSFLRVFLLLISF